MSTSRVQALQQALDSRLDWLAKADNAQTDCVRLLHGTVEGAPGTTVDRYGPILLIQTWRDPMEPGEIDAMHAVVDAVIPGLTAVWNNRQSGRRGGTPRDFALDHDVELPGGIVGLEEGLVFDVNPRHRGRDPLLFLDFRAGRRHIRNVSAGKSVLNLFAYTCGMGVAAAVADADEVVNVDFSASALEVGDRNAGLNGLVIPSIHGDCLPVMRQFAGLPVSTRRGRKIKYDRMDARQWDITVLDPPRWARSAFGAVDVVRDYPTLFKPVVLATAPGGHILATNNVASVEWETWVDILERCAKKAGRPVGTIERIPVDEDFPTPDGKSPLKMAWISVP